VLLLFADTEWACPLNRHVQYLRRPWYAPKDGYFEPPAGPGFGYELDEGRIRSRAEL
jgi:L-alanine-DL-glutamate epimerase-like enolase superfamily enzyme